jgi:hypothetical protein
VRTTGIAVAPARNIDRRLSLGALPLRPMISEDSDFTFVSSMPLPFADYILDQFLQFSSLLEKEIPAQGGYFLVFRKLSGQHPI